MSPQEKKDQPWNRFPRSSLDQVLYLAMLEWYSKSSQSMDASMERVEPFQKVFIIILCFMFFIF